MSCSDGKGCAKSDACESAPLPLTGWDVAAELVGRAFEEIAERRLAWQAERERTHKIASDLVNVAMGYLPYVVQMIVGNGLGATTGPAAEAEGEGRSEQAQGEGRRANGPASPAAPEGAS